MTTKYSIVHIVGLHNRIRPTPQLDRILQIAAKDIFRISKYSLDKRPLIVKSISAITHEIKKKQNTVIIYPIFSSVIRHDSCLVPTYNMPPFHELSYRNLYFAVPGVGYDRILSTGNMRSDILLDSVRFPPIVEYPIAGTDMEKENLLRDFLC